MNPACVRMFKGCPVAFLLLVSLSGLHWTHCQLPDLSDPCASSATQLHDNDVAYFPSKLLSHDLLPSNDAGGRERRGATSETLRLWPDGVVYYTISNRFISSEVRLIMEGMHHWENSTCVRFKPRTNQPHYVRLYPGSGCCSYVGRVWFGSQPQGVSLGRSCFSFRSVVHELGHVIGFWHEQSRPDRDQHIEIISQNIVPGYEGNFRKIPSSLTNSLGVGYDYNSIMHYDSNFFSRHSALDTLRALDRRIPIGMATVLSQLDIEQTNRLYSCDRNNTPPLSTILSELPTPPLFPTLPYSCVSHMTGSQGSFSSPGYPIFRHNTDCYYLIRVPEGYKLRVTFQPIELENEPGCVKDFVRVYDNFEMAGAGQVICANYQSYPYSLPGNTALIHYHTDSFNDYSRTYTAVAGFRASYITLDINECSRVRCSHGCRNFPGSYTCLCPKGYFLSADGVNCFDMNECGLGNGGCDHSCVNTGGSFYCQCRDDYKLQPDGHSCRLPGSFCSHGNGGCQHVCTETAAGRACSCREGYQLHTDGQLCTDENECYRRRSGCSHICTNTIGSYECSCRQGFLLADNQHSCVPERTCSVDNGGCEQLCRDTNAGAVCSCRTGYRLNSDRTTCDDINECLENRGRCLDGCVNTNGSYTCTCFPGTTLNPDLRSCSDINECITGDHSCPFPDRCVNYYGTYRCSCPHGYRNTPDGQGCDDVDECVYFGSYCSHTCLNTPGSYTCACHHGYRLLDHYSCVDINECQARTDSCDRASGATCQNNEGSYSCLCPDGFIIDESGLSCIESVFGYECEFSDECDEGFVCEEMEGLDYSTCQCPPGHTLAPDGLHCQDPQLVVSTTMATTASESTTMATTASESTTMATTASDSTTMVTESTTMARETTASESATMATTALKSTTMTTESTTMATTASESTTMTTESTTMATRASESTTVVTTALESTTIGTTASESTTTATKSTNMASESSTIVTTAFESTIMTTESATMATTASKSTTMGTTALESTTMATESTTMATTASESTTMATTALESTTTTTELLTTESPDVEDEVCIPAPPPLTKPEGIFQCSRLVLPNNHFGTPLNFDHTSTCYWLLFGRGNGFHVRLIDFEVPDCEVASLKVQSNGGYGGVTTICGENNTSVIRIENLMTVIFEVKTQLPCNHRGLHAVFESRNA